VNATVGRPGDTKCDCQELANASILSWLEAQQHRAFGIVDGLDDESLRRPVLPSAWSCLGMIQHLTVMTRFWFEVVMCDDHPEHEVRDDFAADPSTYAAWRGLRMRREPAAQTVPQNKR